jgi:hypothetical protein
MTPLVPPRTARKLRESCIGCSSSKVKCNKEKPTCSRCVRLGLSCEYMLSRRTGRTRVVGVDKPSTTRTTASTDSSSITTGTPQHTDGISSAAIPSHHHTPVVTPHTPPPTTTRPSPKPQDLRSLEETGLWSSLLSPNSSNSTDLSSLLSMNTDLGHLFASLPSSQLDTDEVDTDMQRHEMGDLSVTDPSSSLLMQGIAGTDSMSAKPHPCCLAICMEIMLRLFPNAAVDCERLGSRDGPSKFCTIESVIADNKQIIDTIQTVLECRCGQDEYVATLVSLILFKAMGWYVAVARSRSSPAPRDSGMGSLRPSSASFEEQVLDLPAVVGGYCVDGHHQSRMAAQLVLSELHRVQRLVTLVGRRLESLRHRSFSQDSSTSSSSASSSVIDSGCPSLMLSGLGTSPLLSNTLSHLEDDLRKRLRAVSSETIDILRRA